jgi:hypothetical protein
MLTKVIEHILANRTQYIVGVVTGLVESAILWFLAAKQSLSLANFLTSQVRIPGWLIVLIGLLAVVIIAVLAGFLWAYVTRRTTEEVVNKKFSVDSVRLDGKRFLGCEFDGSNMVYSGRSSANMERCTLRGVRLTLDGPAGSTLNFLATMYHDMDEEGKKHLDAAIEDIRQGRHITKESHYI